MELPKNGYQFSRMSSVGLDTYRAKHLETPTDMMTMLKLARFIGVAWV